MNLRPIGLLLIGLVLLVNQGCSSKAQRIDSGLKKGEQYLLSADWDKASVEVRNVLQIDPRNAMAFYLGARIAEGQANVQQAYGNLLKAVELDPGLIDARVALARYYLAADQPFKAKAEIQKVFELQPAHLGARTIQAAVLAREGDEKAALESVLNVLSSSEVAPADASLLLASLYMNRKEPARALEVIEKALKADPGSVPLMRIAARVAAELAAISPEFTRAPDFLRRAAEAAPKDVRAWNAWTQYHLGRRELGAAEEVMRAAARAQPDDSRRRLALTEFIGRHRGVEAAEKELRAMIAERPKDVELRYGLVRLLASSGREMDAQAGLKDIIELAPDAPAAAAARRDLAAVRLAAGQPEEARKLVEQVLTTNPRDPGALVLRGRLSLRDGQAQAAIADLRAAARDQPGSPEIVGLLAAAHQTAGELQLARETLVDAVKFKPEQVELRLMLAAFLEEAQEHDGALAALNEALRLQPGQPRLYERKAQLQMARKDLAGAERTLQDLKNRLPNSAVGAVLLGQFYMQSRRFDAALKTFDAATAAFPNDPALALAAIGALTAQRRFGEIEARLQGLARDQPRSPLPHQVRGELALRRGDVAAAALAYRTMIQTAPDVAAGYVGLATALKTEKRFDDALTALDEGERQLPKDASLAFARADVLQRAGRIDDAIQTYRQLLAQAPQNEAAINNLGYLLADAKGDPASLKQALNVLGPFAESSNPAYLDTLGWVHYRAAEYRKALPLLERAARIRPSSIVFNTHLGMALVKAGETQRGQELLNRVLATKANLPNADEVRLLAGLR